MFYSFTLTTFVQGERNILETVPYLASHRRESDMMPLLRTVLSTVLLYQLCQAGQPEVTIQQGTVKGLYTTTLAGRLYSTFLGIPYAKPPVGKHRFKEPVPAEPWIGVYNATRKPPRCLQLNYATLGTPNEILGSEDCLYINVYTPQTTINAAQKPLDVIVFIHGGAFMFLSSTHFEASILLDRDVVLVTLNYRLGPLGFLSTGDITVPGNNGMKDQVLALQWVQQNIAAFGGDPNRVTLTGFSAGGASVHYHVLSPLSKGLFKSAICASGSSLNPWTSAENAREKALYLAAELGCPFEDSLSMVKCLRHRPAEHIVETTKHFLHWYYNPFSPFALVVEPPGPTAFLPDSPINILKQGNASDVPILFTFTKEEGLFPGAEFVGAEKKMNDIRNRWNELMPFILDYNYTITCPKEKDEVSQKIKDFYQVDLNTKEGIHNLIKILSDRLFLHGIAKASKIHATVYTSPVYMYRFSYMGKYSFTVEFGATKDLGVCHADDITYILLFGHMNPQETETDKQVSNDMIDLWLSFANGTLKGETLQQHLPKIVFTDIQGPGQFVQTLADELGEEKFWDTLNLLENIEASDKSHDEF